LAEELAEAGIARRFELHVLDRRFRKRCHRGHRRGRRRLHLEAGGECHGAGENCRAADHSASPEESGMISTFSPFFAAGAKGGRTTRQSAWVSSDIMELSCFSNTAASSPPSDARASRARR